jgi:hypothetical protein
MGQHGPPPKRSSQRRRRNKDTKPDKAQRVGKVKRPAVSRHWHPIAKTWFTSLADSGQSDFFEPSDWQAARYVAEMMSKHLKAPRPSAQLFTGIWTAMTDLLSTEASRRRVRMEIERLTDPPAGDDKSDVAVLNDYRQRAGG